MPEDLFAFNLQGQISHHSLAASMQALAELIDAMSEEILAPEPINWVVDEFSGGSARMLWRVESTRPEYAVLHQENIVTAVGAASAGEAVPYGERVAKATHKVVNLVGHHAEALDIGSDAVGRVEIAAPVLVALQPRPATIKSLGSVVGEVDQLVRSKSRFAVLAAPDLRPVWCIVTPSMTDAKMTALYGQRVRVPGEVERDRRSGRPIRVRVKESQKIEVLNLTRGREFESALGVYKMPKDYPPPEERRALWDD